MHCAVDEFWEEFCFWYKTLHTPHLLNDRLAQIHTAKEKFLRWKSINLQGIDNYTTEMSQETVLLLPWYGGNHIPVLSMIILIEIFLTNLDTDTTMEQSNSNEPVEINTEATSSTLDTLATLSSTILNTPVNTTNISNTSINSQIIGNEHKNTFFKNFLGK